MSKALALTVANIVRDAGGKIVGRTRLQKIAYLLTVVGLEDDLRFSYKHYGPFSEVVAAGARDAHLLSFLTETKTEASWGGTYSIYRIIGAAEHGLADSRSAFASAAAAADAVELELMATAVFLAQEGHDDPWAETARRKPEKAGNQRIDRAKKLYRKLAEVSTPEPLPQIEG